VGGGLLVSSRSIGRGSNPATDDGHEFIDHRGAIGIIDDPIISVACRCTGDVMALLLVGSPQHGCDGALISIAAELAREPEHPELFGDRRRP